MARRRRKTSDLGSVVSAIVVFMAVLWAMNRSWFDVVVGQAKTIVIGAAGGATLLIIGIAGYRYLKSVARAANAAGPTSSRSPLAPARVAATGRPTRTDVDVRESLSSRGHSELRAALDREPAVHHARTKGGFDPAIASDGFKSPASSATRVPSDPPTAWSEALIRALEWKRFERLCAGYWQAKGYHAETTAIGADGGVDIVLYSPGDADRQKALGVVQCKAWSNRRVGVKPVRELYGVQMDRGASLAVFMASGDYTDEARTFAEGKHVELITGAKLLALLEGLPDAAREELLQMVTAGDYTTPTCPNCDVKMVLRIASKAPFTGNQFWGCPNFPRCRQRFWMRNRA